MEVDYHNHSYNNNNNKDDYLKVQILPPDIQIYNNNISNMNYNQNSIEKKHGEDNVIINKKGDFKLKESNETLNQELDPIRIRNEIEVNNDKNQNISDSSVELLLIKSFKDSFIVTDYQIKNDNEENQNIITPSTPSTPKQEKSEQFLINNTIYMHKNKDQNSYIQLSPSPSTTPSPSLSHSTSSSQLQQSPLFPSTSVNSNYQKDKLLNSPNLARLRNEFIYQSSNEFSSSCNSSSGLNSNINSPEIQKKILPSIIPNNSKDIYLFKHEFKNKNNTLDTEYEYNNSNHRSR